MENHFLFTNPEKYQGLANCVNSSRYRNLHAEKPAKTPSKTTKTTSPRQAPTPTSVPPRDITTEISNFQPSFDTDLGAHDDSFVEISCEDNRLEDILIGNDDDQGLPFDDELPALDTATSYLSYSETREVVVPICSPSRDYFLSNLNIIPSQVSSELFADWATHDDESLGLEPLPGFLSDLTPRFFDVDFV